MDCRLFRLSDHAPIETVEGYVLARAYDAAWRSLYLCEPLGQHVIERLDLTIDFGLGGSRRN
jgi:hypothetical protein